MSKSIRDSFFLGVYKGSWLLGVVLPSNQACIYNIYIYRFCATCESHKETIRWHSRQALFRSFGMQKGSSFGVWSQYQAPAQPSEDTLPLGSQNRQQDADRILVFLIHNSHSWLVDSSPGMSKLLFKIVALYTALLVLAPDYIYISFVKP